jgi:hypothetical protein
MIEVGGDFVVTDEVVEQAKALGFNGRIKDRLLQMVRESTPFSRQPIANRRFESFMLKVENDSLVSIHRIDFDPVKLRQRAQREERLVRREISERARAEGKTFIDLTRVNKER